MKKIELKSGLRITNFSSPHSFVFDTGEVLQGVDEVTARTCLADVIETTVKGDPQWSPNESTGFINILLHYIMSDSLRESIAEFQRQFEQHEIDVVLVSLPTMMAMKEDGYDILRSPFRVCRLEDRVKKTISSTKFCL